MNAAAVRKPIGGPAAWRGSEMATSDSWRRTLSPTALAEIDAALQQIKSRELDWQALTKDDFPLSTAAAELAEVADLLETGPGIVKLSGFPVERYSDAEIRIVFFALGRHLGTPVFQNGRGQLMNDITDEGANAPDQYGKVDTESGETFLSSRSRVHSSAELRMHNDRTDVVALLCLRNAVAGGVNRISSAVAIHNEMLRHRPDLLELLFQDYYRSRFGEEDKGNDAFYALPVFAQENGHFTCHYSRTYVEAAQLNEAVPKMSAAQWEALDLMAEVGSELALETAPEPGEILFLNNHLLFHARSAYEDDANADRRRFLYRLWLAMPNSRPLPESYGVLFREVRPGAVRGGIAQAEA